MPPRPRPPVAGLIGVARSGPGDVRIFVVDVVTVETDGHDAAPAAATPWPVPVGGTILVVGVLGLAVAHRGSTRPVQRLRKRLSSSRIFGRRRP